MKKGNKLKSKEHEKGAFIMLPTNPRELTDEEIIERMEALGFKKSRGEFVIWKTVNYIVYKDDEIVEESNDPIFGSILEQGMTGIISTEVLYKNSDKEE